jgi:pyridinium-3,5-biscarboxylic acid mononucleotide synthase
MDKIRGLLEALATGSVEVETVLSQLAVTSGLPASISPTPDVCVDLDRAARCGFPEVVYGPGKLPDTIVRVFEEQHSRGQASLATRVDETQVNAVLQRFPDAIFNARAGTIRLSVATESEPDSESDRRVCVVSAGSSDLPVAEEAVETLRWMNCVVELIVDVGVAGPQRLLARVADIRKARAVVVVAGMEGALPSVVAGHVDCPVFGVPTSVGYGANFGGVSALLSMLNSCAANVAVVNIDAGFKAAYLAGLVARGPAVRGGD